MGIIKPTISSKIKDAASLSDTQTILKLLQQYESPIEQEGRDFLDAIEADIFWRSKLSFFQKLLLKKSIVHDRTAKLARLRKILSECKTRNLVPDDIMLSAIQAAILYNLEDDISFFSGLEDLQTFYNQQNAFMKKNIERIFTLVVSKTKNFSMIRFAGGLEEYITFIQTIETDLSSRAESALSIYVESPVFDMIRFASGVQSIVEIYKGSTAEERELIDKLIAAVFVNNNNENRQDPMIFSFCLKNILAGCKGKDERFISYVYRLFKQQSTGVDSHVAIENIDDLKQHINDKTISLTDIFGFMFHEDKEVANYCIHYIESYQLHGQDELPKTRDEIALIQSHKRKDKILTDNDSQVLMGCIDGNHMNMVLRYIIRSGGVYLPSVYKGYQVEKMIEFVGGCIRVRYQIEIPDKNIKAEGANNIHQMMKQDMMPMEDLIVAYGFLGMIDEKKFIADMISLAKGKQEEEETEEYLKDHSLDYDVDVLKSIQVTADIDAIIDTIIHAENYYERVEWPTTNPIFSIKTSQEQTDQLSVFTSVCDLGSLVNIDRDYKTLPRSLSNSIAGFPHMEGTNISAKKFYDRFREIIKDLPFLVDHA